MAYHDLCDDLCELKSAEINRYNILLMWERVLAMLGWIIKSIKVGGCQEEVDGYCDLPEPTHG